MSFSGKVIVVILNRINIKPVFLSNQNLCRGGINALSHFGKQFKFLSLEPFLSTMKTRRKFLRTLAVAGTVAALPVELMAKQPAKQKMIHQVFFWLKPGQDVKDFLNEAALLGKCKTVSKAYIGVPAPTEARDVVDHSYQVACTLFFESIEDQNIYQTDPDHLKFIERNSNKWAAVKVYDFVI